MIPTVCTTNLHLLPDYLFLFILPSLGGGIYVESPRNESLPNNGLIMASSISGRIPSLRALSGSNRSNVGQLIDPLGNDITHSYYGPFLVLLGGSDDPGTMYVICLRELQQQDFGIYTYRTPDEASDLIDVNFGIYSSSSSSKMTL